MKFIYNHQKQTLRYNNINIAVCNKERVIDTIEQLKNVSLIEFKNLIRQQAQLRLEQGYKHTAKALFNTASDNTKRHFITRQDLGL